MDAFGNVWVRNGEDWYIQPRKGFEPLTKDGSTSLSVGKDGKLQDPKALDAARVDCFLTEPKDIWGRTTEEIAAEFRRDGYEAVVEQSTKGSQLSQQIRIRGHGTIQNIQVHPGGGRHGGKYYKISTSTEGVIKVVDRATYVPTPGEKARIIFIN